MHWTQNPRNKAKVRATIMKGKKTMALARRKNTQPKETHDAGEEKEAHAIYVAGLCQGIIFAHANRVGIPSKLLAERVADIIRHTSGG